MYKEWGTHMQGPPTPITPDYVHSIKILSNLENGGPSKHVGTSTRGKCYGLASNWSSSPLVQVMHGLRDKHETVEWHSIQTGLRNLGATLLYPLPYPRTTIRIPDKSQMQCILSLTVAADRLKQPQSNTTISPAVSTDNYLYPRQF